MTPEQLKAWQEQHGGPGENSPSPPDAKGLVTHRAADGAWMVVGPSGLVSYGPSPSVTGDGPGVPPVAAPASSTDAAPAPGAVLPPGTPVTTDQQLRAWLDQHGGGPGVNKNNEKQIDGPLDKNTGAPTKVRAVDSTTVTAPDGATLTLRRPGDGSGQGYEQVSETPPRRTAATSPGGVKEGATRGPQTNPTREAYHNGQWVEEPNPNYRQPGIPHTEGTPLPGGGVDNEHPIMVTRDQQGNQIGQARELTGPERQQWEDDRQRSRNPGNKTDAQLQAQQGAVGSKPVEGYPGYTLVTTAVPATPTSPATTETHYEKDGQRVPAPPGKPDNKVENLTVNGQAYTRVTSITPDGAVTVKNLGPDGKPIATLPGEGTGNQGPALPQMVLGQSQAALRTYRDTLNSQVQAGTITPTIADKRWTEATQVAELGIREATEQHNDEQSRRNADVNIRTNALSNSMSGFNSALDFVAKLNGSLPKGSTAGGEALAAILGLQQLQARRLGAFDNGFSGGAPAARSTPAQPSTGSAIGTAQPSTGSAIGTAIPPPPVAAPPAGTAAPPPPAAPAPAPAAVQGTPSALGDTGAPPVGTPPPAAAPATAPAAAGPMVTYQDQWGNRFTVTQAQFDARPGGNADVTVIPSAGGAATAPAVNPAAGEPGHDPTVPVGMAPTPGSDFAVMQTLGNAPMPPAAPVPLGPPDPGPSAPPPALAHALAASKPPWQMSDDELQGYLDAGVPPEVVWGVPGRTAA